MKNAFIFHGSFGHPEENWIPWLKTELEQRGYEVIVPTFPTPDGQSYDSWMSVVEPYFGQMNKETIFVGHSIGPAFMCCVLEKLQQPIAKSIMASPFLGLLGNADFDVINETISAREFDWEKVKQNAGKLSLVHGDNDPYVPLHIAQDFAAKLSQPLEIIENGGHLNIAAGFTTFPRLLKIILE